MTPNRIKIVCNARSGTLSYLIQNERGDWIPVSKYSPLSQRRYTATTIRESANAILGVIDSVYNPEKRGVEITFEGPARDHGLLREEISERFAAARITCGHEIVRVALAGKRRVGKSTLIRSLFGLQNIRFTETEHTDHRRYCGSYEALEWYELAGLDMGSDSAGRLEETTDRLAGNGLTHFIYCFGDSKVEPSEAELINRIREKHPKLIVLSVRTRAVSEDDILSAGTISDLIGVRVIPVLAKDMQTRAGTVPAFGRENVLDAIFSGT